MTKHNPTTNKEINKKTIKIRNVLLLLILPLVIALALSPVEAKVFTIQNESVNMFVVNGSSGNILLNPNAGFGNVGIGTTSPNASLDIASASTGGNQLRFTNAPAPSNWWEIGRDNIVTGDLIFSSKGVEMVRFVNGGGVGIGTTSPNYLLQVASGTDGRSVNLSNVLFVNASKGAVGVGAENVTTIVAGDRVLEIRETANGFPALVISRTGGTTRLNRTWQFLVTSGGGASIRDHDTGNNVFVIQPGTPANALYINSTGNVGVGMDNPNYLLQTAVGTDGRSVNLSNVLYVNGSSGNVGIGTTSPAQKLHVNTSSANTISSSLAPSGSTSYARYLLQNDLGTESYMDIIAYGSTATTSLFGTPAGNMTMFYSAGELSRGLAIGTFTSDPFILGTANSERMRIDSSGNVGIGTTSPDKALDVVGGVIINGTGPLLDMRKATAAADEKHWRMVAGEQAASLQLLTFRAVNDAQSDSNIWLQVNRTGYTIKDVSFPNGNVGIGTTSPVAELEVKSTTSSSEIYATYSTTAQAELTAGTDGNVYIGSRVSGSNVYLRTGAASTALTILSAGNVGIGTTSPGAALHVVGEVNITGISGDGTGKAVCIKSDRTLGTCSDAVGGSGTCTCG